jgi:MYXO-CTERM domain-containing protein
VKRAFFGVVASLLLASSVADANGRFPESNQLFFAPNDDQFLALRTTFGFLFSKDRGASWSWVCEQAFPLSGAEDPMVAITPSGNILLTTFQGMSFSKTKACNWEYLRTPPLANPGTDGKDRGRVFIDLAANPNDPKNVVVFASSYDHLDEDGGIFFSSQLFATTDEGATFTKLGADFDPTFLGYTLDLTKSDPLRLYVTAVRNPGGPVAPSLLTSKDLGQTFTETPIPLADPAERGFYIAAVDPTNADHLYVRTSAGTDKPSRLIYSDDAGQSWRTLYEAGGPLLGFALSADGSKVFVGGPKDGIRVASTTNFQFEQKSSIEVQCLALATDGLWACSNEKSGFIVGLSKDEGVTFEKKTHFCDIKGPLDCPAGTSTGTECPGRWPAQANLLGCDGVDAGADAGRLGPFPENPLVIPGGGCDCRTSSSTNAAASAAAAFGLAGVLALARRRRRRRR